MNNYLNQINDSEMIMNRVSKLRGVLKQKKLDLALFVNTSKNKLDKNILWLTGVEYEFICLVVPVKKEPFIIVALEIEDAKKNSKIKKVLAYDPKKRISGIIKERLGNVKRIGVNGEVFSINEKKGITKKLKARIMDISKELGELRAIKEKYEIDNIKKACKTTDEIFSDVLNNFKKFKTEKEVANFIEDTARKKGYRTSFETIVASGINASQPHYKSKLVKINSGFCVMDFGVKVNGYCSDMTRTVYVGKPSKKEIEKYEQVLAVQKKAITKLKAGTDLKRIQADVKKALGKEFIHSLGHGIGVYIHDTPGYNVKAKEGMTLAIEPGVYKEKEYGIRIEDDVLITKKGCKLLTKSKKELIIIK